MAIRLSGLNSGLDTDAIVQELVSAYSLKTQKYQKAQTKLEWKQDAWKNLNTKIYNLYTNVSNLRFSSSYNIRKTTVSDSTKATVSASTDAVIGTQTLNISKTAQAGYLTGTKLNLKNTEESGKKVTSSSTLADLGYTGADTEITIKTKDGEKKVAVSKTTKISDFVMAVKNADAGVNINFDENNQRIFVSAKKSGKEGDFSLYGTDKNSLEALNALGLNSTFTTTDSSGNVIFSDTVKGYEDAYSIYKLAGIEEKDTEEVKKTKIQNFATSTDEGTLGLYLTLKSEKEDFEAEKKAIEDAKKAYDNLTTLEIKKDGNIVSIADLNTALNPLDETEKIRTLKEDYGVPEDKVEQVLEDLKAVTEYETNYKANNNHLELSENLEILTEGVASNLSKKQSEIDDALSGNKDLQKLGDSVANYLAVKEAQGNVDGIPSEVQLLGDLFQETTIAQEDKDNAINSLVKKAVTANNIVNHPSQCEDFQDTIAYKIAGSNAEITLNGVKYESDTNSFSINGLTINAQAVTQGDITINTSVDTQGIYDKIKDFLTEYNTVINEITKLYNADSAKDYEPLTDEEKEAMSEDQIEKWESKIKDSLLRRDTTLSGVMSAMTNSMAQSIVVGGIPVTDNDGNVEKDSDGNVMYKEGSGTTFSLSSFGIQTLGFLNAAKNEQNAYHIDGDEDDENTSGKTDKLMKAIQENADQVCEFMQRLTTKLYSAVDKKMKSTTLSSAYKVYNDKELDSQYKDYTELIKKWEEKIADKEDYYYKKFTAMETALSKLQSQTNSLSGLIGY